MIDAGVAHQPRRRRVQNTRSLRPHRHRQCCNCEGQREWSLAKACHDSPTENDLLLESFPAPVPEVNFAHAANLAMPKVRQRSKGFLPQRTPEVIPTEALTSSH